MFIKKRQIFYQNNDTMQQLFLAWKYPFWQSICSFFMSKFKSMTTLFSQHKPFFKVTPTRINSYNYILPSSQKIWHGSWINLDTNILLEVTFIMYCKKVNAYFLSNKKYIQTTPSKNNFDTHTGTTLSSRNIWNNQIRSDA